MNNPAIPTGNFWRSLWKKPLVRAALIIVAVLVAYLPATRCGYIWDDDVYVTENELLSAPDGLHRIWFTLDSPSQYFPLVYTTFRAEYAIWGLKPAGYHWVNIALHIANALLVWRLLARLKIPGAWLAAAIFALHPVHVESVAWITERKNVLSVFFFLLALLAWTEFIGEELRKKWRYYALALLFYALALFSKTTACTLPAALILILWLKHQRIDLRRWAQVVPFLALGAGMGLLTVWWERYHQGTQGKLFALGLGERLLVATHAPWFYLGKLLWPVDLTFSYPLWTLHPWSPLAYGWLLAGIALCWMIYCAREDIGRGGEVAALFFVATLSPMLGFIMLYTFRYSFVADHYQYAASIGPIALFSACMVKLAQNSKKYRNVIHVGMAAILLALGVLTWSQCHTYLNDESIWRDTLAKNPDSLMAHYNLANGLMRQGNTLESRGHHDLAVARLEESLDHYNRALEIAPTFVEARGNRADIFAALHRPAEAAADFAEALRLEPGNAIVENQYGMLFGRAGHLREAAAHFQKAVEIQPHYALARKNLADALTALGDPAAAAAHYEEVARMMPGDPQTHLMMGDHHLTLGNPGEALREYREALRLDPQSLKILTKLSWLLATCDDPKLRDGAEAEKFITQARSLPHGENAASFNTLAAAYAAQGRFMDAVTANLTALELATQSNNKELAAAIRNQMRLYKKGHTLYEPGSR